MVLNRIIIFSFIFLSSLCYGKSILPVLTTKQAINNLRFFSDDGKFTYYQRRSGSLLLGTNYKVTELLKGAIGTNYLMYSSPARKKLLIAQNDNYHTFFSPRVSKDIYSVGFGESKAVFLGKGISPKLHLNDEWASFYDPYQKVIIFKNLNATTIEHKIKLKNPVNPYFTPQVLMLDSDKILFSDINTEGYQGIILYKKNSNKSQIFYKLASKTKKVELCLKNKQVIIAEFGLDPLEPNSFISTIPADKLELSNRKIHYNVNHNDLGNLVCTLPGSSVYFIKNTEEESKKLNYEAARINLRTNSVDVISDLLYANQILDMDGKLLLPLQGKYYVLLGENNMTQFDLLKPKEKE